jgi:hypothetical protein
MLIRPVMGSGRGRSATVGVGVGAGVGVGGRMAGVQGEQGMVGEEVTVGVIQGRLTPVMVGEGQGHRYRRSERVVLEGVE